MGEDFNIQTIDNSSGDLCAHYPAKIVVIDSSKDSSPAEQDVSVIDVRNMREIFKNARFARYVV